MVEFMIEGDVNLAASRILVPIAIGTVLPGVALPLTGLGTVQVSGGTVQQQPSSYFFTNVSATVKGAPGVLYQILVAGETGLTAGPGTLLVLDGTATVAVIPVAAGGFQSAAFGPGGVSFGTLIASVIGTVDATFVRT